MPWTPGPGGVVAEQRNMLFMGVSYDNAGKIILLRL